MRISHALSALAISTFMITGCANNKDPATNAVTQAENAVAQLPLEAAQYAPEEYKAVQDTIARQKANLAKEEYKMVINDVPQINKQIADLREVVTSKQTQAVAATNEWQDLNTEVPPKVEQIENRVQALAGSRLPQDVTKENFEAAKASLEAIKTMWTEAVNAYNSGDALVAADKGREVQAKLGEIETQLAMNPV